MTAVERGSKSGKEPSLSVMLINMKVGDRILSIKTQPISLKGEASKGTRKVVGVAAAAGSVEPAAVPAQTPQSFTLAVPLHLDIMTNVAVR